MLALLLLAGAGALYFGDFTAPPWTAPASLTVAVSILLLHAGVRTIVVRLFVPVAVSLVLILLYDYFQTLPAGDRIRNAFADDGGQLDLMVEIFNATVSTIYALLVAFLVFKNMQDHDSINYSLREEALHLDSLSRFLSYLCDERRRANVVTVREIQTLLVRYAENVISDKFQKAGHMVENQEIIDDLVTEIGKLEIEDENDRMALDKLISHIDDLAVVRLHRIGHMVSKTSPYMVLMLIVLSVFVVAPFFLPHADAGSVSSYFVACLGFVLTFLFLMMVDMSSHFDGYWKVDRSPFSDSKNKISQRNLSLQHPSRPRAG